MLRFMAVDDEPNILRALGRCLKAPDRELELYTDPLAAVRRAQVTPFDLILVDFRMPQMDGVEVLTAIKDVQPEAMRLILSGINDMSVVVDAVNQAEIFRFLRKPWDDNELRAAVDQAIAFREITVENRRLADQVRQQARQLDRQQQELSRLEREHPGIIRWSSGDEPQAASDADDVERAC